MLNVSNALHLYVTYKSLRHEYQDTYRAMLTKSVTVTISVFCSCDKIYGQARNIMLNAVKWVCVGACPTSNL